MKPRISMITLGVQDLKRATAFYHDGLGFPLHEASSDSVTFFDLNGTWLGLYGREALAADATVSPRGTGFDGFALAHNVASIAEVDRVIDEAERAGATIVKAPETVFWGGYSGYFRDPEGHLWEVAYNPHAWVGPADD